MRLHEITSSHPAIKTYATRERAVAAIDKVFANWTGEDRIDYTIIALANGRFAPVFLPSSTQVQLAINAAHHGVFSWRMA